MQDKRPASCTVLVVDDEPDIRHLLRVTLEEAGYGVVEAAHGEACGVRKVGSRGEFVFVDESADHVSALDGRGLVRDGELSGRRIWRLEAE